MKNHLLVVALSLCLVSSGLAQIVSVDPGGTFITDAMYPWFVHYRFLGLAGPSALAAWIAAACAIVLVAAFGIYIAFRLLRRLAARTASGV